MGASQGWTRVLNAVQGSGSAQAGQYLQAQQPVVQDAQGPAAAAESFVTQVLSQLSAQQGQPIMRNSRPRQ